MYTITFPVKSFVKKYITVKYKCENWRYTRNDRLGKYFYAILGQKPANAQPLKLEKDELTVEISQYHADTRGTYLDQDAIEDFTEFIYEEIVEGIVNYITGLKRREGIKKYERIYIKEIIKNKKKKRQVQNPEVMQFFEIKEVIFDHLMRFDITENDIPFERIAKNVYRRMNLNATVSKSA